MRWPSLKIIEALTHIRYRREGSGVLAAMCVLLAVCRRGVTDLDDIDGQFGNCLAESCDVLLVIRSSRSSRTFAEHHWYPFQQDLLLRIVLTWSCCLHILVLPIRGSFYTLASCIASSN